jgi:ATP-dependent protease ClpP protease subunit
MQDSDRNYYLTAPQAVEYGLVDDILSPEKEEKR